MAPGIILETPSQEQPRKLYEMGELKGVELERVLTGWRDEFERGRIDGIPPTILHNLRVAQLLDADAVADDHERVVTPKPGRGSLFGVGQFKQLYLF